MREYVVGIGFAIMMIGCAGADSSLKFAATLIVIGSVIIFGGLYAKKGRNKKSNNSSDYSVGDILLYRNRKGRTGIR